MVQIMAKITLLIEACKDMITLKIVHDFDGQIIRDLQKGTFCYPPACY